MANSNHEAEPVEPHSVIQTPDLKLAPLDPATTEARRMIREVHPAFDDPTPSESGPFQFLLKHMLFGMTITALALAVSQWMSASLFAGLFGTLLALALIPVVFFGGQVPVLQITWGALLATYIAISIGILLGS